MRTPDSAVPVHPGQDRKVGPLGRSDNTSEVGQPQQQQPQRQSFYPTDAKVREKERRQRLKEEGHEHVVKKRKKVMENHYDDCGDDMSSLHDRDDVKQANLTSEPCDFDTEDELEDQDFNLMMKTQYGQRIQAYPVDPDRVARPHPVDENFTMGPDPRAPTNRHDSTCPACRNRRRRDDWEHTREIGQCAYPHDDPKIPICIGCQDRRPRSHVDHSYKYGECQWATAPRRAPHLRRRRGEPHEPRQPIHAEPTVGILANVDGRELGAEGEDRVQQADYELARRPQKEEARADEMRGQASGSRREENRRVEPGRSSSSGSRRDPVPVPGPDDDDVFGDRGDAWGETFDDVDASGRRHLLDGRIRPPGAAVPPPPEPHRQGRGLDREQRTRRTFRDAGDNPERPNDWSNFDIGRVVRLFRTNREPAIRQSLRKLHVRWWHASEKTMHRFLDRVGVSQQVLDLIPKIVQTCRVCREWAKPGPSNASNIEMSDTFHQQVECDLLFIHKNIVFHMLDKVHEMARRRGDSQQRGGDPHESHRHALGGHPRSAPGADHRRRVRHCGFATHDGVLATKGYSLARARQGPARTLCRATWCAFARHGSQSRRTIA